MRPYGHSGMQLTTTVGGGKSRSRSSTGKRKEKKAKPKSTDEKELLLYRERRRKQRERETEKEKEREKAKKARALRTAREDSPAGRKPTTGRERERSNLSGRRSTSRTVWDEKQECQSAED